MSIRTATSREIVDRQRCIATGAPRHAAIGADGSCPNEVADTVSATAKAHTIHNFIRAVLWSVIGRKKKNNISRTRRVLIRSYTAVPFRFPDRMTGDVRSFCGPSHKALCR